MAKLLKFVMVLVLAAPGMATGDDALDEKVRRLEQRIQELEAQLKKLAPAATAPTATAPAATVPAAGMAPAPPPAPKIGRAHV